MGDIVNLKQARKRKARAQKDDRAAANRILFGRTKSEKQMTKTERVRSVIALDGHKREPGSDQ